MELLKFKLCPECGKRNPPSLLECKYCEADLTGVRIVSSEQEAQPDAPKPCQNTEGSAAEAELVRICDCGAINPPQARKCRTCGEDISDILPTQIEKKVEQKEADAFSFDLKSVDGEFSATIDQPTVVVGREAALSDYLADKVYVSRQHARFTVAANKVFVENLSRTNRTFVNNEEIPDATPVAVSDGDEIGLGGKVIQDRRQDKAAYFVLRVST